MNTDQLSVLLEAQQQVIEKIALGAPLEVCLSTICLLIESLMDSPHVSSSILLLKGNQLRHGAAPRLPQAYCRTIDGVLIGPEVGSCGTAVFTGKQVIVSDIGTDPLWANFKTLALQHNLRACWSTPILSSDKKILGSFAIYYSHCKTPEKIHLDLIERFTYLSGLAIEKAHSGEREQSLKAQLQHSKAKLEAFSSVMPDLGLIIDADGLYVDIYGAEELLTNNPHDDVVGLYVSDLLPEAIAKEIMSVIHRTLESGEIQRIEYELELENEPTTFEGRTAVIENYLPEQPERPHVLWMARDITERKEAERQIEQLAFFDPLTRLPNRRLLNDRLHSIIERVERDNLTGALLFIDLDDFKRINDSLGHSVGDALLTLVAERLKPIMRECDTIARLGGDEFVIILENLKHNKNAVCDEAATVAQKLLDSFLNTFKLGNSEYKISISIGISLIEDQHTSAEEVLMRADTAMYRAKKLGGDIYAFYEPEMQDAIDTRLRIEGEITHAIQQEQFTVFFQPQVDHQGQPIGAEALIRWLHPDKGLISPEHFIPVAEQSGLILALQNIVVTHVCQLIVKLEQNPRLSETFSVAINISPSQFKSRQLEKSILPILDQFKLSTNRFKLEITESMLMNNIEDTINQMEYLKDRGFRFSIDDFGTGYSSLAYLHAFPIDELKIDKTFIDKITEEKGGTAIVDAIIALSNHLQFHVIAEGVETQGQATLLSDRQIKGIQGYFFAKPMTADDVIAWIEQKLSAH